MTSKIQVPAMSSLAAIKHSNSPDMASKFISYFLEPYNSMYIAAANQGITIIDAINNKLESDLPISQELRTKLERLLSLLHQTVNPISTQPLEVKRGGRSKKIIQRVNKSQIDFLKPVPIKR
jgi:spermidine/putrescine-binding protein